MSQVTIHRCPGCSQILENTNLIVAALTNDGIIPAVRDGTKGEFRIDVGNKRVIEKKQASELPSVTDSIRAVEYEVDSGLLAT